MTSVPARIPQGFVPVDQVVDLRPLAQRSLLHKADQSISIGLRLGSDSRSIAGREPVGQGDQLHAVSDDFAIDLSGFHTGQPARALNDRQCGSR